MSHATEAANIVLDDRVKKEADSWVIEKEITQSELHEVVSLSLSLSLSLLCEYVCLFAYLALASGDA